MEAADCALLSTLVGLFEVAAYGASKAAVGSLTNGLPHTFRAAVEEVAFTGRVVYIGYRKELVAYETMLFVQKELDIMGSRNAMPDDFHQVIRLLEGHRFPVQDAVSIVVPIEESPGLLRAWSDSPASYSKIMVRLD